MSGNTRIEKVLRIAIRKEAEAHAFYLHLVKRVDDPSTKDTLAFLAREETKHQRFLEDYLHGDLKEGTLGLTQAVDYKIVENLEDDPGDQPVAGDLLSPQQAFLVAAKREKAAHLFYLELSHMHPSGPVRDLLLGMSREELLHKEKVEYLYANTAFPQTAGG